MKRRVIACLDVRSNDNGDLVVTKGDSYDVREKDEGGDVRNLGKPVELAGKYFKQGAGEVAFLNITGYRDLPLTDAPMLEVLRRSSETVFVPLTVGGGIRDFTDSNGKSYTALEVASSKRLPGRTRCPSVATRCTVAEEWYASGKVNTGKTSIEQISERYGVQAVVISIDPRRQYVADPSEAKNRASKPLVRARTAKSMCGSSAPSRVVAKVAISARTNSPSPWKRSARVRFFSTASTKTVRATGLTTSS